MSPTNTPCSPAAAPPAQHHTSPRQAHPATPNSLGPSKLAREQIPRCSRIGFGLVRPPSGLTSHKPTSASCGWPRGAWDGGAGAGAPGRRVRGWLRLAKGVNFPGDWNERWMGEDGDGGFFCGAWWCVVVRAAVLMMGRGCGTEEGGTGGRQAMGGELRSRAGRAWVCGGSSFQVVDELVLECGTDDSASSAVLGPAARLMSWNGALGHVVV